MVFNRFQLQVLLRLLFIVLTCYAVTYISNLNKYWVTLWNLIALLIVQIILLFRFLTQWQKDLKVFADSVRHGDYTISYNLNDMLDVYYDLYDMLNSVTKYVRQVKSAYVQQNQYFQYVVENTQVGLLAYDENGTILLSNKEALKLTHQSSLGNIKDLRLWDEGVYSQIISLGLNQPRLLTSNSEGRLKLSGRLSKFVIDGRHVYLLSLLNIRSELEENELQSWQDLISVLTHEIMNSVTPIHSLNGSMAKYLSRIKGNEEIVAKAMNSMDVINRRSQSLMNFVERYRKISTVPLPHLQPINTGDLIEAVTVLLQADLLNVNVTVQHGNEIINADYALIEQVLINLFKNAIYAVKEKEIKEIVIAVYDEGESTAISISDNGKGMTPDVIDKIFIPFFTTREEGSGIGLTFSRQVMQRHNGSIEVFSQALVGTKFTLLFPKYSNQISQNLPGSTLT